MDQGWRDYRARLQALFEERVAANHRYTLRAFAARLRIGRTTLKRCARKEAPFVVCERDY
jgi:hypothetical protein